MKALKYCLRFTGSCFGKKKTCVLCFESAFSRSYYLDDWSARNNLENDSDPMFLCKWRYVRVLETAILQSVSIHSEIVSDFLSFSLNRRLRVGIWSGDGGDCSLAVANLRLTRVLIPTLWHSPSSL